MDKIVIKFPVTGLKIVIVNNYCGGFVVRFIDKSIIEFPVSICIVIVNINVGGIIGRGRVCFKDRSLEGENSFEEKVFEVNAGREKTV